MMNVTGRLVILLVMCLVGSIRGASAQIADDFEASSLGPDWIVVMEENGTLSVSDEKNYTPGGQRSLEFASTSGGQRYVTARRYLGQPTKGAIKVAIWDDAPNQETLYFSLRAWNSASGVFAFTGMQDYDAFCYKAAMAYVASDVNMEPTPTAESIPPARRPTCRERLGGTCSRSTSMTTASCSRSMGRWPTPTQAISAST
jgi:hypothetical protein